ncbi:MAG: shikimate kinase [Bacteriovorax sp.]
MKILLCGFMGAGKSTLLKKFQPNKLGFECIDLDHALACDLGIRPERLGEWIMQNGFPLFRDLEKTKLIKLLEHENSLVIALGAGALNPEVLEKIEKKTDCKMVFLNTGLDLCRERIRSDSNRPLAKIPREELGKLYLERCKYYLKADLVLSCEEIKEIEGLESLVHNLL